MAPKIAPRLGYASTFQSTEPSGLGFPIVQADSFQFADHTFVSKAQNPARIKPNKLMSLVAVKTR